MSHCFSLRSWKYRQQFPPVGPRQKLERLWKKVFPTEPFHLSDFPFLHLSSGHKTSTLFPMYGCHENQMKSHPWKCSVSRIPSSNQMGCDAFICNLGEEDWATEEKQSRELAFFFWPLTLFPILQKSPQNFLRSAEHPCRQVLTLLFYTWGNKVGWSTRGFAYDVGFPGAQDFQCLTLRSSGQTRFAAVTPNSSPRRLSIFLKPPRLVRSRVGLERVSVTLISCSFLTRFC